MKSHKIKYGGDFSVYGWDETFRTYCGLTENNSDDIESVYKHEPCSCKKCNQLYEKELNKQP